MEHGLNTDDEKKARANPRLPSGARVSDPQQCETVKPHPFIFRTAC
jgi:hypothetical protein